jgi:hypothetical protein
MTDSDPKMRIASVNEHNQEHLVRLKRRHLLNKAFLKAKDRRKNFERGEFAGFLYAMGLGALVLASTGQLNNHPFAWWQRVLLVLLGLICLVGKTYTKRRFWKQTEDAEYQEEEEDDGTN